MLRKIVFGFLISNLLLFTCKPMEEELKTDLGQLKNSLGELKTKLETLNSKLEDLEEILGDSPYGNKLVNEKAIFIDSTKYCDYELWQLPALRNYVRNNCKNPVGTKAAFNVIERTSEKDLKKAGYGWYEYGWDYKEGCTEYSVNRSMIDPKYKGAVFQLAANDRVQHSWRGGYHAQYVSKRTKLRKTNEFVDDTLKTTDPSADNIRNICVAINEGLQVVTVKQIDVKDQIVNVVLTAGYNSPQLPEDKLRMENCLEAGYKLTLLAAIKLNTPRVVLTFLGGHVFANDPDAIFEAIRKAVRKYVKKYNLNVTVYLDDSQFRQSENTDDENLALRDRIDQRFRDLRREINGGDANIGD